MKIIELNKIKKAILYKEYSHIAWGIQKNFSKLSNRIRRFFLPSIIKKTTNRVSDLNCSKNNVQKHIYRILGDPTSFIEVIKDIKNENIIQQADRIIASYYSILGSGETKLYPINWNIDFKSDYEWKPGKYYTNYTQVDLNNTADVKIPRELSRSHHFLILGQAYLLTNDEKYTEEFIKQIESWLAQNPFLKSINWCVAMDVAIRSSNWVLALNMFIRSDLITDNFLNKILVSLYQHGYYININLEKSYQGSGNHYDSDIAGLLVLGLLFIKDSEAENWFEFSKYALFQEIRNQILPSGLSADRSLNYNRLVTELFFYSFLFLIKSNYYIPPDIHYRMKSMFDFIESTAYPDGSIPNISDQDNGRYLPFGSINRHRDISYLMAIALAFYKDPKYKAKSQLTADTYFLLGQKGINDYKNVPKLPIHQKSCSFSDVGFFKFETPDVFLLINNGLSKYIDNPFVGSSHMHADLLSFVLYKKGIELFIDPGTYTYSSDYQKRNKFRSTLMHNTICIDNQSQFIISSKNLFSFDSAADIEHIEWKVTDESILYGGRHNAYHWMIKKFSHMRSFNFILKTKKLIILDKLEGESDQIHNIKFYLHTHPKVKNEIFNDNIVCKVDEIKQASVIFKDAKNGQIKISDSICSNSYGTLVKNQRIEFSINSTLPLELLTTIEL